MTTQRIVRPADEPTANLELHITSTDLPLASESDAVTAKHAPDALAYLRRCDALDLADMLGIGGAA